VISFRQMHSRCELFDGKRAVEANLNMKWSHIGDLKAIEVGEKVV